MFSKSKTPPQAEPAPAPVKNAPPSIISADLKMVGDLFSEGEIQVDGAVDGDIRSRSLLVGQTAHIKGSIVADTLHVHGHVTGQIRAKSVHLAQTSHVVGDILHENLAIETGAFLEGHCKRITGESAAPAGKVAKVAASDGAKASSGGTSVPKGTVADAGSGTKAAAAAT